MFPETQNIRKKLEQLSGHVREIDDRNATTFRRISDPIFKSKSLHKIFQVRSWPEPQIFDGLSFDRVGIYNCIEMVINDDVSGTITGTESTLESGDPNRITDKEGATDPTYRINNYLRGDDYSQWDSSASYNKGDVVYQNTQYTDANSSETRTIENIYKALLDNVNRSPATNSDYWQKLTVEVFNLCEQYATISLSANPKLAKYDILYSWATGDNNGTNRYVGSDTFGNTRIFYLDLTATSSLGTGSAVGNIAYGNPISSPTNSLAVEGELNYHTTLNRVNNLLVDYRNFAAELKFVANWIGGSWFINAEYPSVSGTEAMKYNASSSLAVKVDGTTIGFNGSGELEVI